MEKGPTVRVRALQQRRSVLSRPLSTKGSGEASSRLREVPAEGLKESWENKKVRLNLSQPPRSQCQFMTESHQTSKNFPEPVFLLHFHSKPKVTGKLGIKGKGRSKEPAVSSCLMQEFMSIACSWFHLAGCMCGVCGLYMLTVGLTFELMLKCWLIHWTTPF